MSNITIMYSAKKPKKPYDGPPRPNLLSHDKTIRETKTTIEQLQIQNRLLAERVDALERKLERQTQYLQALHTNLSRR